jgi:hypothetical protein
MGGYLREVSGYVLCGFLRVSRSAGRRESDRAGASLH